METLLNHTFSRVLRPVEMNRTNTLEVISYGKILIIEGTDITHLQGEGNYTFVHTKQGKKYLVSKTMKTLQANLSDSFVRTHKSYTINIDYVVSWLDTSFLLLRSGEKVPVARRRIRQIDEVLAEQYLRVG